ncbi:murein transglycosylase [Polymorphobacter multimanifer]|uniref:peptidoglycan lytic exotransglycosylase n=1 Tax=Polymorphobacter multimanifer TaxID=1070431 RepID=A0A841L3Z5_9SPHN|nr:murein transglycosylase A [Polymorphobacter multimanifer]MBB6227569.1 membrane-bound lytic murein transglycosylase A [Polymorphobacter multimanifer]GGI93047.1 murein transglycosylase [Polymorphobacter multimanifer]
MIARRPPLLALASALLLAACATQAPLQPAPTAPPPAAPASAPTPAPAPASPAGPSRATDLVATRVGHDTPAGTGADALAAFRAACPSLARRKDRSGLTIPADWAAPCAAVATARDARSFFNAQFAAVRLADGPVAGRGFATGYFEPEIAASRTKAPGYATPLYKRPPDLVEVDLGSFREEWKGRTLRGRLDGNKVIPYPTRADIAAGALAGKGLEIAWAADANEAFFLEIQGSGRLRLPDGRIMRIGYESQNGRDYVPIGRVLKEQGKLKDPVSMASILGWLRANPGEAPAIRAANPSAVFFRELTDIRPDQGPIGSMGHPLTPRVSAAVDPAFTPYGAPLIVELPGQPPVLQVAADTGGAIRGPGRIDMFRGPGAAGAAEAGGLASPIDLLILLPKPAAERLLARKP